MAVGRLVGLDIGDVRIGVAVSDPLGIVATPKGVITRTNDTADVEAVAEAVREANAVTVVAGLPLNQHGEVGPQAEKTLDFIEKLKAVIEVPIETIDERFTTLIAKSALAQGNLKGKKRKGKVDQVAAQQILQTYLDRRGNRA